LEDKGGTITEGKIQKDLADRLIAALRQDGFVLYAQPILSLADQAATTPFQEILTRFREEEEKLLPPGTFFPLLEEYGLLPYLDRWVIGRLAKWIKARRAEKKDWRVPACSINLAADTLYDANFCGYVAKHIDNAQLPPGTFHFEMSWENALNHAQAVEDAMIQLKRSGCRFILAGFDGSEESFSVIQTFAPNLVKLNYGVLKEVERSLVASEKLERINAKCHAMKIKTIAEYVETRQLLDQLRMLEIDYAQGLVISPPRRLRLEAVAKEDSSDM
jgi:EAL domain-containing protein (putative c-di-GMP-specific phosphodiesterase class I)